MTDLETKLRRAHDSFGYGEGSDDCEGDYECQAMGLAREAAAIGAAQRQAEILIFIRDNASQLRILRSMSATNGARALCRIAEDIEAGKAP